MAIKIYADAGSNLFQSILDDKQADIHIVKMPLYVEDKTYICYDENINVEEMSSQFYQDMIDGKNVRTSLINPATFLQEFKLETDQGNKVVCFIMAKGISGTYQSACMAAQEINEEKGQEVVHVVDSATAGFGEGMQALHAYDLVKEGKSFASIVQEAEDFRWKVRSEFTVDNIKYLGKTGRVKPIVAKLASLLKIKILLKGSYESNITMTGKTIGRIMSIKKLASTCLENIALKVRQTIFIAHCEAKKDAEFLKDLLVKGGLSNIEIYPYDLITGSHVGPGALALFYVGENRD